MKFSQRLGYYMGGFAIGMVFLAFFLTGKRAQCTWLPEDRVLADIRRKSIKLSPQVRTLLQDKKLDTLTIQKILLYGDVDFGKSNTDTIPCNVYYLEGKKELAQVALRVQNCDKIATVLQIIEQ